MRLPLLPTLALITGFGCSSLSALSPVAPRAKIAFTGATVIDPGSGKVTEDAVLVIDGERIVAVGPRASTALPAGARVIEAKGRWILPGYIDTHVHFFQSGGLYTRPDAIDLNKARPYAEETALIRKRLPDAFERYLRSGVTSVVDIGGPFWNFDMRQAARENPRAPRVAAAGPLISSVARPQLDLGDPPIVKISSADEAQALVSRLAEKKPDYVKIWYVVDGEGAVERFRPIVRATIQASHALKIRVAVHATELEAARTAVEEGADLLVHSVTDKEVDDAFVKLVREKGVILTPSLVVFERYARTFAQKLALTREELAWGDPYVIGSLFDLAHLSADIVPERIRTATANPNYVETRANLPQRTALKNLKKLQDAGVVIAAGTDAGNIGTIHGPAIFREFALMKEAGLTPMQILADATANGAKAFSSTPEMGVIQAGKLADLVVLRSNPLADIAHASDIETVVKDGVLYAAATLAPDTATDLVQRQLNAYNAHDLEAFVACYAPDAKLYGYPETLMSTGHADIRARYGPRFAAGSTLHARVVNRMAMSNVVIDHERVTGLDGGKTLEAIAIYEVRDGLIQAVRFKRAEP